MEITVKGYAKINLHLDVLGIRDDGYHSVQTVMQTLDLCDDVTVILTDSEDIVIECNIDGVPTDEKNIAYKAARLFFDKLGRRSGAHIKIEKRIPMAAGMAGGSADAAATLVALNKLLSYPFDLDGLCTLGAMLGADVPFCIACGTKYSDGKGEILHDFPSLLDDIIFVAACGGEGVSTPWAYRELDGEYNRFEDYTPHGTDDIKQTLIDGEKYDFCKYIFNIFEKPILAKRPVASDIKKTLLDNGALCAMMSGSGPSVFAVYEECGSALAAVDKLKQKGYFAAISKPISQKNARYSDI